MVILATAESEVIPEFSFFSDNALGIAVGVPTVVALFIALTVLTVLTLCCMYSTF